MGTQASFVLTGCPKLCKLKTKIFPNILTGPIPLSDILSQKEEKSYKAVVVDKVFISSAQLLSYVQLFVTSWNAAHQASLSITNS